MLKETMVNKDFYTYMYAQKNGMFRNVYVFNLLSIYFTGPHGIPLSSDVSPLYKDCYYYYYYYYCYYYYFYYLYYYHHHHYHLFFTVSFIPYFPLAECASQYMLQYQLISVFWQKIMDSKSKRKKVKKCLKFILNVETRSNLNSVLLSPQSAILIA